MKMTLDKMLVENFKGISRLEIEFGERTDIYARNGLGKTTIADAYFWVLFGKDSAGNSAGNDNFRVKPLDEFGQEIHNLKTNVVLSCRLDGDPFVLRRQQEEKWTKKRGHAEAVYEGNVSTYWINGVELGLKEYEQRIRAIADEDIFDMIAMLGRFNAIDWKKRRELLIGMSGTDVDSVLWSREEYAGIAKACKDLGVSIADLKKVLDQQRRGLKRDLDAVPIRIDEVKKGAPVISEEQIKEAEYMVQERGETVYKLDQAIAAAKAEGSGDDRAQRLTVIVRQMKDIQDASLQERALERSRIIKQISSREDASVSHSRRIAEINQSIERTEKRKAEAEAERDRLRKEYSTIYGERFEQEISEICPTCGQKLPEEQLAKARERIVGTWINDKKTKLASIKDRGIEAARRVADAESYIINLAEERDRLQRENKENGIALGGLREDLDKLDRTPDGYLSDPTFMDLDKTMKSLLNAGSGNDNTGKIRDLEAERQTALDCYNKYKAILDKRDQAAAAQARISELQAEHKALGVRMAEVEKLIMLADRFAAERCSLLEQSINKMFPTVSWKLFDAQINGGIADTCVCMIPCGGASVPYATANTASKIHADVEIINVMSRYYGVSVPLFVDNRERVNVVPCADGQIITLSVSDDEQIRVEK